MRWIDPKFRRDRKKYIVQSLLASFVIFVMTIFIDIFINSVIIASLGATVFILFTMPHKKGSRGRYLFGGYSIGILAGLLSTLMIVSDSSIVFESLRLAVAVGLAIFFMVVTDTEHPPAAAMAMGIALDGADIETVIAIYVCLTIVFISKKLMSRWLIDLV